MWKFTLGLALLITSSALAQDEDAKLAGQAKAVLKKYCYRCHGIEFKVDGLDVLKRETMVDAYITPKDPDSSYLWERMALDEEAPMPPPGNPTPTGREMLLIQRWINQGAPDFPPDEVRTHITTNQMLTLIRDDLLKARREDRPFLRYFTLTNLFNNSYAERIRDAGNNVDDRELRLIRGGISKVVNSLSMERRISVPEPIDEQQTILRIDMRDYGWQHRYLWREMLKQYPYGLSYDTHPDAERREIWKQISEIAGEMPPFVRADWFIDTATRSPLYDLFLDSPDDIRVLERRLGVDPEKDFMTDELDRAGFAESGVSQSNRLVDRHVTNLGYYWKSYDFAVSEGEGNLFTHPLGPKFPGNPFGEHAFKQDGGEMIYSLPNGLQAYYLADGAGKILKEGPVTVVRDPNETSGAPTVVNAISCMGCHRNGMIHFQDTIRSGLAVNGRARLKVQELFPEAEDMKELLQEDQDQFLRAYRKAIASFMLVDDDANTDIMQLPEPVQANGRLYQGDLGIEEIATELGYEPKDLQLLIQKSRTLRELGLGPLADGKAIQRSTWASTDAFITLFHRVAIELDEGTPLRSF